VETVGTKKQAEARRRQLEAQLETGGFVQPSRLTFREYLRQWFKSHAPKLAPATRHSYQQIIEDYIIPRLGHINLQNPSPLHLEMFCADILAGKQERGRSVAYNGAVHAQGDPQGVAGSPTVAAGKQKCGGCRGTAATGEGQIPGTKRICSVAAEPYRTIIYLAFYTGLRIGEILVLRPEDIPSGYINVSKVLQKLPGQEYVVKEPKRHSIRQVPIPNVLAQVLSEYRPNPRSLFLFSGENEQPLHPPTVYHAFIRYSKHVGIEGVRFHDLRHAYATMLLCILDPRTIQELLGHRSAAFTLHLHACQQRAFRIRQTTD